MKNKLAIVAACAAACCIAPAAFAAGNTADPADMPAILTFNTNIYGYQGPDNSFTILLGAVDNDTEFFLETGKTSEYIVVDKWTIGKDEDGDNAVIASAFTLSVPENNSTVTLHGDPSMLDYIDLHGCYLNSVEFSGNYSNLVVVDLSHNELDAVDLSGIPSLQSIDLTDNAFTVGQNMKIGTNHPNLQILQVGINEAVDPELDLKNFPELQYFSARNNYAVTSIDPTKCPELVSLVLEVTNITDIDVSKNPKLDVLNLSNTKVTSVDVSNNPLLGELYISHEGSYNNDPRYKVTNVDVSKNPKLQYLDLSGNRLTSIDLTNNTDLILLYLQKNLLTELDLSRCTKLASVNLSNNLFTFATLPLPGQGWDYLYFRSPLSCYFKYKVGEEIDFSSEVLRAPFKDAQGNTITPVTDARVFTVPFMGEPQQLDPNGGFYQYADGKIKFLQTFPDSVFIKFSNSVFNDWDLDTQNFMVKSAEDFDKPVTAFTFKPTSAMNGKEISFSMGAQPVAAGLALPAQIILSVGGQTIKTVDITTATLPEAANVTFTMPSAGGQVDALITDGYGMTALAMDNVKLQAIDLSQAVDLYTLSLKNASLMSVDLSFNRALRDIDLSNNFLSAIDLTPVRGDYEKWSLRNINLSNNMLTSIKAENSVQFTTLDLSNNWFSAIDLKYFTGLAYLDLSNNRINGDLDLSAVENLATLNIEGNDITSIELGASFLQTLNVADNYLNFASLPALATAQTYTYAPQKPMRILPGGASINLSDQNVGGTTTYVWKYADTKTAVDTDLYTLEDGITRFSDALIGQTLFCEMTNTLFPAFSTQPLTTTGLTVKDKPTNLVASFTPTQSGPMTVGFGFNTPGSNAVYIDWNGDGSQYDEYIYDTKNTDIYRSGNAVAGKTAKIYTYGDPTSVSMLFINNPDANIRPVALANLDATPMTKAVAFDIHNAGLTDGSVRLPISNLLNELVFDGNAFTEQVFTDVNGNRYPALRYLVLGNNRYTSLDLAAYPTVEYLNIADNMLSEIKTGQNNNSLIQLNATGNRLTDINLNGLNALAELLISDNNLTEIDITPVKDRMRALQIAGNRFTFATLPKLTDFNTSVFKVYDYFDQQPMEVECKDGIIDLSDQLEVPYVYLTEDDTYVEAVGYTTYLWFLGDKQSDVYYDYNYEMFMGEELEGPSSNPDDPEYVVYDGETRFRYTQKQKVICAMTNPGLSSLILYTVPAAIDRAAGVEDVSVDNSSVIPVDVYTISGVRVRTGVMPADAIDGLAPGLYIVGNRKVFVK